MQMQALNGTSRALAYAMSTVRILEAPDFKAWLQSVPDKHARNAILVRIRRLSFGNSGDTATIGQGVRELRIHLRPGWRIYYTHLDPDTVLLLNGGTKASQADDIKQAKRLSTKLKASG